MKFSIIITETTKQVNLEPETEEEARLLKTMAGETFKAYSGEYRTGSCQGGWVREYGIERNRDPLMLTSVRGSHEG